MKNIKPIFPLFALFSAWIIAIAPSNTLAQQQQPNVRKEHLEYCVKQLPVTVAQLEAIKAELAGRYARPPLESTGKMGSISVAQFGGDIY